MSDAPEGHMFLGGMPRATGKSLIFSECNKYGTVRTIDYDPSVADMFDRCKAFITYDTLEIAHAAVQKLSKRLSLFGSDQPIEVRLISPEEIAYMKQPPMPQVAAAVTASEVDEEPADARQVAEIGIQIRERAKDRKRGTQEGRGSFEDQDAGADRYQRPRRREQEAPDADFDDRQQRPQRHVQQRRGDSRERRPRHDERDYGGRPPRGHRRDGSGRRFCERSRSPEQRPQRRQGRAPPDDSLRDFAREGDPGAGQESEYYSDEEAEPAAPAAAAAPKNPKLRAMSGFDKKEAPAGASAIAAAAAGGPQVVTRGNWAEISAAGSTPFYGNLMTGAKTFNTPSEFGIVATPGQPAGLGGLVPAQVLNIRGTSVNSNLYVGMMPIGITETEFRQLFAPFGNIMSTRLMGTKNRGLCGFVKYTSWTEAQMAINSMNGLAIRGTRLKVKLADQDNLGFDPAMLRLQQGGAPSASI